MLSRKVSNKKVNGIAKKDNMTVEMEMAIINRCNFGRIMERKGN